MHIETGKLILVTGATGYIAPRLVRKLVDAGCRLRAMARDPSIIKGRSWSSRVELVSGDVLDPSTLPAALSGVHTAYYLIHQMNLGRGYLTRELEAARAFASAAKQAGVNHIIYLGGLADPAGRIAPHLRSRIETGNMLRQYGPPVTEFRAGAIIGSGSISFEMIRFMMEMFPILPTPLWLRNKSQPIAAENVIDYLSAALDNPAIYGKVFEIGGPEVTSYADLMLRYARGRGLRRRILFLPYLPLWFMSRWVGWLTPVPRPIAYALIEGLSTDSVVTDDAARRLFPEVKLIAYDQAAKDALDHLHPDRIEPVWDAGRTGFASLKHEGFFIQHQVVTVPAPSDRIFSILAKIDGPSGGTYANWLWRLHAKLDEFIASELEGGMFKSWRSLRLRGSAAKGDHPLDFIRQKIKSPHRLLLHSKTETPAQVWLEWRLEPDGQGSRLVQTGYFVPRGLPGFLYWYLLYPFHKMLFRSLIRAIIRAASSERSAF